MKARSSPKKSLFRANAALKISFIYAVFSAIWILFSDQLIFLYVKEAATLTRIQMLKGWFFITATALLIYILLRNELARRQQSEDQVKERERQLFTLTANLPGMAYRRLNDEQWTIVFASQGSFALTGYHPAELIDNQTIAYRELIEPDERQPLCEQIRQALARKKGFQLTYRIKTAAGQKKWVWEQGTGIFSTDDQLLALEGFIADITAEKQAVETLLNYRTHLEEKISKRTYSLEQQIIERQGAEKKFRDLLESAPDAMALVDHQANIILINRQMEILFGYDREELLHQKIEVLIPERFRKKHRQHVQDFMASHRPRPMGVGLDIYALPKSGKEFPADISLSPLETKEGLFVLADIRDITERKEAEKKIIRNYYFESTINAVLKISLEPCPLEEQLARILDAILAIPLLSLQKVASIYLVENQPELLVLKAQRGYTAEVLATCARIPFGSCLCGQAAQSGSTVFTHCLEQCHKCYHGIFPHGHYIVPIISSHKVLGVLNLLLQEGHGKDQQEEEFLSSIAATLAGIIVRQKSESEKERLRKQLMETEKLSALGRMMAGVAHEIRNPLTAVGGLTRRLDKKLPPASEEKEYARVIISESARLERILKNVLIFTRAPNPRPEANDIQPLITESLHFLEEAIQKKSIQLRQTFTTPPRILMAREDALTVIDNLLSNAIYATPPGGSISIATGREDTEARSYVTVEITDTGEGISEKYLGMIFEPFFTTKPVGPGHGIGLGLPISRKIMEEYHGRIKVKSKPGAGTSFKVFFPAEGRRQGARIKGPGGKRTES